MHHCFQFILVTFFIGNTIIHAQPADPPQKTHNFSLERPKSKFKLSREKYQERIDFTKIDTNAIYINQQRYGWKRDDTVYVFLRFFKDALFESGSYIHPPTDEEAENLTYGSWRCYTFDKKTGMLVIEVPKPFMMSSNWMYLLGELSEDSLKIIGSHGRYPEHHSAPSGFSRDYYKRSVEFKNRAHVWFPATKEDLQIHVE